MEQAHSTVPSLLTAEALRQRIKPHLSRPSWRNWLSRAYTLGFPRGLRIGERTCAWREDEVTSWLESRERGGIFAGRRRGEPSNTGTAA